MHITDNSDITKTRHIIEKMNIDEGDIIEKKNKKMAVTAKHRATYTDDCNGNSTCGVHL